MIAAISYVVPFVGDPTDATGLEPSRIKQITRVGTGAIVAASATTGIFYSGTITFAVLTSWAILIPCMLIHIADYRFTRSKITENAIAQCREKTTPNEKAIKIMSRLSLEELQQEAPATLNKRSALDHSFLEINTNINTKEKLIEAGANPFYIPERKFSDFEKLALRAPWRLEDKKQALWFIDITKHVFTPEEQINLFIAADHPETITFLCNECHFDPNAKNDRGKTAIEVITKRIPEKELLFKELLNQGAHIRKVSNFLRAQLDKPVLLTPHVNASAASKEKFYNECKNREKYTRLYQILLKSTPSSKSRRFRTGELPA